jgi:hypothetical protein
MVRVIHPILLVIPKRKMIAHLSDLSVPQIQLIKKMWRVETFWKIEKRQWEIFNNIYFYLIFNNDLFNWGLGFGVWGLGFGVWGLGFGVWGLGFGVWGVGFGV